MKVCFVEALLACGLFLTTEVAAQNVDPALAREFNAVRAAVAVSNNRLQQYTWVEHTEIVVGGDLKSSADMNCRYDGSGRLVKTPIGDPKEKEASRAVSRRPMVRAAAKKQDYLERAVTLIRNYVPMTPGTLDYVLQNGRVTLGQQGRDRSEIRIVYYFQKGDQLVFTYDTVSKALLTASISSTLGSPKDPVTMEATFETLPDGVTHLATTVLTAKSKKMQVKTRNTTYQKLPG